MRPGHLTTDCPFLSPFSEAGTTVSSPRGDEWTKAKMGQEQEEKSLEVVGSPWLSFQGTVASLDGIPGFEERIQGGPAPVEECCHPELHTI